MEVFLVYLWLQLDTFIKAVCGFVFFSLLCTFISAVALDTAHSDSAEKLWEKRRDKSFILAIVLGVVATLLPSSKTMAYMVGAHYATKLAASPEANKVMSLVRKQANEILDKELAKK